MIEKAMQDFSIRNDLLPPFKGGAAFRRGGCYDKHFVISFLKGMVTVLRTFHCFVCPFLAGF
jgi:hypothetical protein